MKKSMLAILFFSATVSITCISQDAHAVGLGVYLNGGGGQMSWDNNGFPEIRYGGGFILDTNCAEDNLLNYRFNLGVNVLGTKYHYYNLIEIPPLVLTPKNKIGKKALEISLTNTVGFGIILSKGLRLWIGPEINFSGTLTAIKGFSMAFGLACGLNFNIGESMTIAVSGSGRIRGGMRTFEYHPYNVIMTFLVPTAKVTKTEGGVGGEGIATVAFMYRIKDNYSGQ